MTAFQGVKTTKNFENRIICTKFMREQHALSHGGHGIMQITTTISEQKGFVLFNDRIFEIQ